MSLVRCPFVWHGPTITSRARRVRVASARATPPPYRRPAQWHVNVRDASYDCPQEATAGTSEQDLASRERAFSLLQCHSVWHGPITISVTWRACVASARAAPPPHIQPLQWRACVRKPDARRSPRRTRRSTALNRGREAFRWYSALPYGIGRFQPARHGARASQALVLRLHPTYSYCSGALACVTRRPRRTRRSAVVHGVRKPCLRCSTLTHGTDRLQSARPGARASQAFVLCLIPM